MTAEAPTDVNPLKKYETVVSSGQATLRALLTMNGGATIAFLTFIGNLWDKGRLSRESADLFVGSLQYFVYGTFFAVLGYGTIFIANCFSRENWNRMSNAWFAATVVVGLASIVFFLRASRRAVDAFHAVTSLLPQ